MSAALLRRAEGVLRSRFRPRSMVMTGNGGRRYRIVFLLPGVLRVYDYRTGELMCQSQPGELTEPVPIERGDV